MPNGAEQTIQQLESVAGGSLVLNLAGGGVHLCGGQRRGGSGSRWSTLALAVYRVGGFSRLRALFGLGPRPQTPDSTVDIGSQHRSSRVPLVRESRILVRALVGITLGVALLCLPGALPAQIVAPAGRTLFNHGMMVRSVIRIDNFSEPVPGLRLRRITNSYAFIWGAHTNWNVSVVAPLVSFRSNSNSVPAQDFTTTSFGDGRIFVRYDAWVKNVAGGSTRLSPEIGVKVPSGGTFGTGSTDVIGGLVFSHVRDPHWWIADVEFTKTTTGDGGLRRGNLWEYDLAYLFRVWPRDGMGIPNVMLVLELNGESRDFAQADGIPLSDSGGNLLFFSPGVEYIATNRIVLEFSTPIPIRRDMNGIQPKPSSSFIAGVRWLF